MRNQNVSLYAPWKEVPQPPSALPRVLFGLAIGGALVAGVAFATGCAGDEIGATEQALSGDHGIADVRNQYALTGTGVSGRALGELVGPINSSQFSQIETDLNAIIGAAGHASCTRANGCLTFVNQDGNNGPWPTNDATWVKTLLADLVMQVAANPSASTFKIVVASSTGDSDGLTALQTMDGLSVVGAHLAIDYSETATHAQDMEDVISPSTKVYTARAGLFPGLSPEVVAVAATDYTGGGADFVWSQSASKCSAVFSKQTYEPSLCSGGMRIGADISAVGKAIPIQFQGNAITFDSLTVPAAFVLGRLSLQTSAIATRADLFAGASNKVTDVTSGTDAFSHTPAAGADLPTGRGVPAGNLTK